MRLHVGAVCAPLLQVTRRGMKAATDGRSHLSPSNNEIMIVMIFMILGTKGAPAALIAEMVIGYQLDGHDHMRASGLRFCAMILTFQPESVSHDHAGRHQ